MACLIDNKGRIAVVFGYSSIRLKVEAWVMDKITRRDSYADQ